MEYKFNIEDLTSINVYYMAVRHEFNKRFNSRDYLDVFLKINEEYPKPGKAREDAYADKMLEIIEKSKDGSKSVTDIKNHQGRLNSKISSVIKRVKELDEDFKEILTKGEYVK